MIIPDASIIKAWFVGQSEKEMARAVTDLENLSKAMSADVSVRQLLLSPIVEGDLKADLLRKAGLSELSVRFIAWINKQSAWADLPKYISRARRYLAGIDHSRAVEVSSAVEMSPEEKSQLAKSFKVKGKNVRLTTKIDPGVIGGLVIDFGGKRYDLSLRGRLNQMNKIVNNLK